MRITDIRIRGYKALMDVDRLVLRGLNVVIGPNGSGKTSLMEVFLLLAQAMREALGTALAERGGINDILTRDRTERLELELRVESKKSHPLV